MIDGIDGGFAEGLAPDPGDGHHHDPHADHHMYLPVGGEVLDLGDDLIDVNHDGIGDTVSIHEPDGLSVVSDINEDGMADRVTTFGNDGTYETWTRGEGTTEWVLVEHGRVGGQ